MPIATAAVAGIGCETGGGAGVIDAGGVAGVVVAVEPLQLHFFFPLYVINR
jgi:hypothetical protein